jgi:hypothetical protein
MKTWNLENSCFNKFKCGDKVKTRGDMGEFNLVIVKIYNDFYAACKGYGKIRHFNMNVLEKESNDSK